MRNYFLHMNFEDIVNDLIHLVREDQVIMMKGKQLIMIATMIVAPTLQVRISESNLECRSTPNLWKILPRIT